MDFLNKGRCAVFAMAASGWLVSSKASATTLPFGGGLTPGSVLPADYGSSVQSGMQDGFTYVQGNAFTPEVTLRFASNNATAGWIAGNGVAQLAGLANDTTTLTPTYSVTFTSSPTHGVHLNRLRLVDTTTDASDHIVRVEVWSGRVGGTGKSLRIWPQLAIEDGTSLDLDFVGCMAEQRLILRIKHLSGDPETLALDDLNFDQRTIFRAATSADIGGTLANLDDDGGLSMVVLPMGYYRHPGGTFIVNSNLAILGPGDPLCVLEMEFDVRDVLHLSDVTGLRSRCLTDAGVMRLARCHFEGVQLDQGDRGGWVQVENGDAVIDQCFFGAGGVSGHSTAEGGAIYSRNSALKVERSAFYDIHANGTDLSRGGAICVRDGVETSIFECFFQATGCGSERVEGGVIHLHGDGPIRVASSTVWRLLMHCDTGRGGGLYVDGPATIENCHILSKGWIRRDQSSPEYDFKGANLFIAGGTTELTHSSCITERVDPIPFNIIHNAAQLRMRNTYCVHETDAEGEGVSGTGTLTTLGGNLVGSASPDFTWSADDVVGVEDAYLALGAIIGFFGGHIATARSFVQDPMAIDAGTTPVSLRYDARGFPRVAGAGPDSGPLEYATDSDEDDIPDFWEIWYKLDPANPDDAQSDRDHDGQSAIVEFETDTDPNDPQSCFGIRRIVLTPIDIWHGYAIEWQMPHARSYNVEKGPCLPDSPWCILSAYDAQQPASPTGTNVHFLRDEGLDLHRVRLDSLTSFGFAAGDSYLRHTIGAGP